MFRAPNSAEGHGTSRSGPSGGRRKYVKSHRPVIHGGLARTMGITANFAALRLQMSQPLPNPFKNLSTQRVFITGGTGFIGTSLVKLLLDAGHNITILARNLRKAAAQFQARVRFVQSLSDLTPDDAFDVIINLAGAPVLGPRWSQKRQAQLLARRVGVTRALTAWLATAQHKPGVWVQASAIGFYGVRNADELLTETSAPGKGFMAELCGQWEQSAQDVEACGVRKVVLRLGVVFGAGGALPPLLLPHRFAMGGRMGSGQQVISWIHLADLMQIIGAAIDNDAMQGIYNTVAPQAITQSEFSKTVGRLLNRPVWFHIPAKPVRWAAGEMAELLLDGQHVQPARLLSEQFNFSFPTLEKALQDLV